MSDPQQLLEVIESLQAEMTAETKRYEAFAATIQDICRRRGVAGVPPSMFALADSKVAVIERMSADIMSLSAQLRGQLAADSPAAPAMAGWGGGGEAAEA